MTTKFCISLGQIDKKLLIILGIFSINEIISYVIDVYFPNDKVNEFVDLLEEGLGGMICGFIIPYILKFKKKNESKINIKQTIKDYILLLILYSIVLVRKTIIRDISYDIILFALSISQALQIIIIFLVYFCFMKYKYYKHNIISLVIFCISCILNYSIIGNYKYIY